MKTINFLTFAMILLFGASSSLQAQCSAYFTYTNTGNNYSFTTVTDSTIFNPVYVWTIDDYNNNTTSTVTTTSATLNHNFSGGSPFGYHYACVTVYDSLSNCQTQYCDSIYTNTNPCNTSVTFYIDSTNSVGTYFYPLPSGFQSGSEMYYWDFGNGVVSNSFYPTVSLPNGWHYVCLTVTDSICTETFCDSVYVNYNGNPCAGFSVTHSHTVSGNTASFTSNVTGGAPAYSYNWNFHGLGGSALANPSFTYPGAGWYAADLTIYDTLGCQTTYHDSVYIAGSSCSNITVDYQYTTSGNSISFNSNVSGFFPLFTQYSWDFGNGTYSYTANPTTQLSTGWHFVCLTVTDSFCTDTYCDSIYVNNGTNPCNTNVSFFDSIRVGNDITFHASSYGFDPGFTLYSWDFGNGTYGAGISPTVNLSNGWHYVCLTVTDSICTATYCDSIYVNNGTNPCNTNVSFFDSIRVGNDITFHASSYGFDPGFTLYSWDFGNGTYGAGISPTVNLSNGWHYVCLTITDSICTATYCDSIYVNNGTNPCNTTVSFIDSTWNGTSEFIPFISGFQSGWVSYYWDFGNGNVSYNQYPQVNLSNGWHLVCLTVTDSICTETYCDSIYISNGTNPCAQNSVTLNLLFDNYATETSWTVTNANGTVVANGGNYSSAMNGQNLPINLCLPTGCYNFNIYDSYGDGICCLYGNGNYSLVEDATGAVLTSGGSFAYAETTNFCVGGASNPCGNFGNGSFTYSVGANGVVTFTPVLTSNQYPLNYAWDFGNGNVSSSSNPTFTFANGYHLVCVTADSGNCSFTYCDTIMVTTNNGNPTGPCANLTTDINITQSINDPFLLWMQPVINGAAANAAFTFVWDFGDNTGAMSGAPLHTYNSFGSYVVCLMALDTMNGCVSTFCDTITVDSSGNFSRNATKPGFTINMLPPVINYYTATDKVEENAMTINLFPNPANNVVNLAISTEEAINGTVSILDVTGKVAYMNNLNVAAGQEQVSLPVDQLPSGVYLVRITSETTQQTMKFIKE